MMSSSHNCTGIHILAKPIGSTCNLDCKYCYYTEKQAFYDNKQFHMSDEVLENYIKKYIAIQKVPVVEFVWHGGEPILLGLDFFRQAVLLQAHYTNGKEIRNSIQTNGTLLTDEWCAFFKKNNFLVGLSIDGPQLINDRYRVDHDGCSAFTTTIQGLKLLKKHKVEFNVLACVAKETAYHPLEVYDFFKAQGVKYIQFTPIVERVPDAQDKACHLRFAMPSALEDNKKSSSTSVMPFTVEPEVYGDFLIQIFEKWVRNDVGKIFVMNFEWALNAWMTGKASVCQFSKQCGASFAIVTTR